MAEVQERSSAATDRSVEVALIVLGRYLNSSDPGFADYLVQSYRHAEASGILETDLKTLRVIAESIGRPI